MIGLIIVFTFVAANLFIAFALLVSADWGSPPTRVPWEVLQKWEVLQNQAGERLELRVRRPDGSVSTLRLDE